MAEQKDNQTAANILWWLADLKQKFDDGNAGGLTGYGILNLTAVVGEQLLKDDPLRVVSAALLAYAFRQGVTVTAARDLFDHDLFYPFKQADGLEPIIVVKAGTAGTIVHVWDNVLPLSIQVNFKDRELALYVKPEHLTIQDEKLDES